MSPSTNVTFDRIVTALSRRNFGVLSTVMPDGRPHSVGVVYGVPRHGSPLRLYVMTRRQLRKARNAMANPHVSFVVPLTRRFLWFLPPHASSFRAEPRSWTETTPAEWRYSGRLPWAAGSCPCTRGS